MIRLTAHYVYYWGYRIDRLLWCPAVREEIDRLVERRWGDR